MATGAAVRRGGAEVQAGFRGEGQEFHLLVSSPSASKLLAIVVPPDRPMRLEVGEGGVGRLVPVGSGRPKGPETGSWVLEPLPHRGSPLLLLLTSPAGEAPRVNGHPAPLAALLACGDEVKLPGGRPFQVNLYQRPELRPPDGREDGKTCPVCTRGLLEPTAGGRPVDRVYVCSCGGAYHAESDPVKSPESRLACWEVPSACYACSRPILREAGYARPPEAL